MDFKKRLLFLLLSTVSAALLYLAWPTLPFFPLIFIAFTPLLWMNQELGVERLRLVTFGIYTYIALALFNIFTTWWVWNSTPAGATFAMLVNALLMTIPWLLYRITTVKMKMIWWSHFCIVPYFIVFEYWHLNWELSWPWLTLGNATAIYPALVQWYEWTGVLGGSLWILMGNVLLFSCFTFSKNKHPSYKKTLRITLAVLFLPMAISLLRYITYTEQGTGKEVVVIQPNIDPYTEKYPGSANYIPYAEQYLRLENLTRGAMGQNTDFVLWPETSFPDDIEEEHALHNNMLQQLQSFATQHPRTSFLVGADSYQFFDGPENEGNIAYAIKDEGVFYTPYNAGVFVEKGKEPLFYHKSRLVPGVEVLPYPHVFGFLTSSLGDLVVASVGKQKERKPFVAKDNTSIVPIICYESIYGEFLGAYVKRGAGLFFIITNDAWWGNTPGHQQHFHYARLRAVEHRKCIARAANTGISGFIDQKGNVLAQSEYNTPCSMRKTVLYNPTPTLYSRLGDVIGWLAIVAAILFSLLIFNRFRKYV
jgi:apolipoprotein N-acyltransferase